MKFFFVSGAGRLADANLADSAVVNAPAAAHHRTAWQGKKLFEVGPCLVRE
jgi:hypothetical protein